MLVRKQLSKNVAEIHTANRETKEYTVVLLSYGIPVAYRSSVDGGSAVVEKTNQFWGATTKRHVNNWCRTDDTIDQAELDQLLVSICGVSRL